MNVDSAVCDELSEVVIFECDVLRSGSVLGTFSYLDATGIVFPDLAKEFRL